MSEPTAHANIAAPEPSPLCGTRCPLIWELGGVCQCIESVGHVERQDGTFGADHLCSCGTWFSDEVARSA